MSFGEGDLHERVEELEKTNRNLAIKLDAMIDFAKWVQAECDRRDELIRDMLSFVKPVAVNPSCGFGSTCPQAVIHGFEERMEQLGIEGD